MNKIENNSPANPLQRLWQRLPGSAFARDQLDRAERRLLRRLRRRLDQVEREPQLLGDLSLAASVESTNDSAGALLHELLARSQEQTRAQAETEYFLAVLRTLVPDQARILAALSAGSIYPLIHVQAGSALGLGMRPILECVSNVGKSAGVQCPDLTHVYVQDMLARGLVVIDATVCDQIMQYELLETETVVRTTLARIKGNGQKSRMVRHTLRMSAFGERLWAACQPAEE